MRSNPELVLLSGLHDGAHVALSSSVCVVGAADGCDVVLRDPGIAGMHAMLNLGGVRPVLRRLGAVNGPATAEKGDAAPADEQVLDWYQPFALAGAWAALVPPGFAWGEVKPLPAASSQDGGVDDGTHVSAPDAALHHAGKRRTSPQTWTTWAAGAVLGLGLTTLAVGSGAFAGARQWVDREAGGSRAAGKQVDPNRSVQLQALRGLVAHPDRSGLRVLDEGSGPVVLSGFVADAAQLEALVTQLRTRELRGVELRVQEGAELSRRASEFLGADGVKAVFELPSRLVLLGRPAASTSLDGLKSRVALLAREVASGVGIEDRIEYGALQPAVAETIERPMPLRIVEVHADEPANFRTAEGGRFFVGAKMPDGAEVIAIASEEILFRRDGRPIVYRVVD